MFIGTFLLVARYMLEESQLEVGVALVLSAIWFISLPIIVWDEAKDWVQEKDINQKIQAWYDKGDW
jgi:hypothetical protein